MGKSKRDKDRERLIEICEFLNIDKLCADLGLEAVDIAYDYIEKAERQAQQIKTLEDKVKLFESSRSNEVKE